MIRSLHNKRKFIRSLGRVPLVAILLVGIAGIVIVLSRQFSRPDTVFANIMTDIAMLEYRNQDTRETLVAKNKVLQEKVQRLEYQLSWDEKNNNKKPIEALVATIVARPPFAPASSFLINKGSIDGVQHNDMVLVPFEYTVFDTTHNKHVKKIAQQVVGRIVSLGDTTAHVESFSARDMYTQAFHRESQTWFTVQGNGGFSYRWEAPRSLRLSVGQYIWLDEVPLKVLGVISAIEKQERSPAQTIHIRPLVAPASFHTVYVVI